MKKDKREIILEALEHNVVHPDVSYLWQKIKECHPKIGIATVYRNLNKMASEGKVKKIIGLNNSAHFDHNTFEHYHFICTKCGKIYDVSKEITADIVRKTEEETGFVISQYDITFSGICKNCKEKNNE